jgi:mannose-1-phosphate guanylyltransferase
MLPVAGVPFTVHQILRARDAGITRIVLATSYRAEVFASFIADADLGIEVVIATEEVPLGTGGAIRFASSFLQGGPSDPVVIFNGDVLTGLDIDALINTHQGSAADVTLYLTRVQDPRAYGLVPTSNDGRVLQFLEKPQTPEEIVTDQINAGAYVFTRSVIESIPDGRPVSVEREIFPALLAADRPVMGVVDSGYWLDLGQPMDFVAGSVDLVLGKAPSPAVVNPGDSLILPDATVDATARIDGGSTIGARARVGAHSHVNASVVFDTAVIGAEVTITNSIIGEGVVIGDSCVIVDSVVGDFAVIGSGNELRNGARVWVNARLDDLAIRFSSDN